MLITECKYAMYCGHNKYVCFEKLHKCPFELCELPSAEVEAPKEEPKDIYEMCVNDPAVIDFLQMDRQRIPKHKYLLLKYFKLGMTQNDLCSAFELHEKTVHSWLKEAGLVG